MYSSFIQGLKTRQGEQGDAASPRAVLLLSWTVLRSPLRDFPSRLSVFISQGALDALEHTVRSCGEKVSFRSPAPKSGFYFLQGDVKNSLPCLPLPRSLEGCNCRKRVSTLYNCHQFNFLTQFVNKFLTSPKVVSFYNAKINSLQLHSIQSRVQTLQVQIYDR